MGTGALGGLEATSCFPGLPQGGDGGRSVTVRMPASGLEPRFSGRSRAWPEPLEAWTLGPVAPGAHPALPAAEAGKSLRNGAASPHGWARAQSPGGPVRCRPLSSRKVARGCGRVDSPHRCPPGQAPVPPPPGPDDRSPSLPSGLRAELSRGLR